ncbi:MAG TPA: alpha-1,4-glucan--maltose-1-phosphate maltosyltransferase [Dehalococcoidales bacterium]|nr:alpha-1,4-glucan--maltose-1-phosphate maltosyltransferase [Dehalococcoidales bacterium]
MKASEIRQRVIIESVSPEVDKGRFPAKTVAGDTVIIEADLYADGHDTLSARLLYRREEEKKWTEKPMRHLVNDRWRGSFVAEKTGNYVFTITAWVDPFLTWREDLKKRVDARQEDLELNILIGSNLISGAKQRASRVDRQKIAKWLDTLNFDHVSQGKKVKLALSDGVGRLMEKYSDRSFAVTYPKELVVAAEREKAGFSTWYEMFPRSCASETGKHGTFKDCEARLPYIAEMAFDVLYFPPIHLVGHTDRKGKNNTVTAGPGDPGTPWAIGAGEGGHKAINPELGTLEDFKHLMAKAGEYGIEIALDIAFQCSPDHPYIKEHPEWFLRRPDGSIQYAENPPKKYQDIYPLNFEMEHRRELWEELKSIVVYWAEQGVRIFRVDNPHTKPFHFWEWLIAEVKKDYPDAIFLAEAFTRPKVMYRLARLGFTQSYTYFTWRNSKRELTEYLIELTQSPVKDFFRPNFWPNTPDILHAYLQTGGRPAFMTRLVLAATLCSNYGIYGPAFELMENTPRETGSEEYFNSEKYEIKHWDIGRKDSLKDFIGRVNRIRRENPALQRNYNLWFNATNNEQLLCYSKHTADRSDIILVVVNLDPHATQSGTVNVPLNAWGFSAEQSYHVRDLLNDRLYTWRGEWNPVELDPKACPAHIFQLVDSDGLLRAGAGL